MWGLDGGRLGCRAAFPFCREARAQLARELLSSCASGSTWRSAGTHSTSLEEWDKLKVIEEWDKLKVIHVEARL